MKYIKLFEGFFDRDFGDRLDLVDIPGDNPMGRTDIMDSLEFMPGHFIHNRGFNKTNSGLQKRGLTKSNLNILVNAGLVSKSAKIPINFLEEKNGLRQMIGGNGKE